MMRVGLVGCAATKGTRPAPARELYTSQLFRKASRYAEATCDEWWVLSAEHGLVHPDRPLEPYDTTLPGSGPDLEAWGRRVHRQLHDLYRHSSAEAREQQLDPPTLVVLAGYQYRHWLTDCSWPHEEPMAGMGIGDQLHWLTRQLRQIDGRVLGTDAARAIGRFNPDGPTGYRARSLPAGPIRDTRTAAEADERAHLDRHRDKRGAAERVARKLAARGGSHRIVVRVEPCVEHNATRWRAACRTGVCAWVSESQVVKVAAEDLARVHRHHHRVARGVAA